MSAIQQRLNALDSRRAIRVVLAAGETERTVDAARRVVAERDQLRAEVDALKRAAREFWEKNDAAQ